ncbi:hypothetical protein [Lentzea jiangxiensis]|uniref:Uncharacterized protein n=1 Tax=Lentzea jiangxiensis TaxID=641025 RepID=A0A1H0X8H8_9PSEU|nr:hypothetical protein [Lentzea jiangxiensis]SDP99237.1 hypothetical protein SAMN05421507_1561 [Lentzea jiangxiensis]
MDDVVEPARTATVPTNFVTDGMWVWTDIVTYYLRNYRLAPEPLLLQHIRQQGQRAAMVHLDTFKRAVDFVLKPSSDSKGLAWRIG